MPLVPWLQTSGDGVVSIQPPLVPQPEFRPGGGNGGAGTRRALGRPRGRQGTVRPVRLRETSLRGLTRLGGVASGGCAGAELDNGVEGVSAGGQLGEEQVHLALEVRGHAGRNRADQDYGSIAVIAVKNSGELSTIAMTSASSRWRGFKN